MEANEEKMVQELIDYDGGDLRSGEIDFIEKLYAEGDFVYWDLSQKQASWLESIWDRIFG